VTEPYGFSDSTILPKNEEKNRKNRYGYLFHVNAEKKSRRIKKHLGKNQGCRREAEWHDSEFVNLKVNRRNFLADFKMRMWKKASFKSIEVAQ